MNLKNKLAVITATAMLAFVGTGFAAWTFTKSVDADVASITGKVTAAIEAKELKVQDGSGHDVAGLYLICDAPSGQTDLLPGEGIYWSTKNDTTAKANKITSLKLIGSVNEDDNDIADITTYDGHFASTALAAVNGEWVNIAAAAALDQTVTSTSKDANVEYVWTLPAVSYAKVPTSVEEVNALETEVNALSLTFAFTFNVSNIH